MTGWRPAFAAMLLWAVHFILAYGLMLIFPDASWIGPTTVLLGAACLFGLALLTRPAPRNALVTSASLVAAVAIIWQSLAGLL